MRLDLHSDTATTPSSLMRLAMAEAEVGDEQRHEDPTVNALQERVADLLGKAAALFLPSGTMCNQVAFAVQCRTGDEVLLDITAHPYNAEGGGPALFGAQIHPLSGTRGVFTAADVHAAIRPGVSHGPRSRVLSVEQTSSLGGGSCWSLEQIREVTAAARAHDLQCHLDGARLFNAVVATATPARDFAAAFDSCWIDLSKGLGAPIGAVLAGSVEFIEAAWRWKHRLGGAMRQAGLIAAAGLYALRHNIARLAEDHDNARALAQGLSRCPGIVVDVHHVETNIVLFDIAGLGMTSRRFVERILAEHAVLFRAMGNTTVRAVTHLDIDRRGIERAIAAVATLADEAPPLPGGSLDITPPWNGSP